VARVEVNISLAFLHWVRITFHPWPFVSDIAIFVVKRDVKLRLTNCRCTHTHLSWFLPHAVNWREFLWPPYGIGQAIIILPCGFCLSSFYLLFPRLISAVGHWMSTILACLPYFHTWCRLRENLECMSETYCTRLDGNNPMCGRWD